MYSWNVCYCIGNSLFNREVFAGSKFWFRKKGVALYSWNVCYCLSNSLYNREVLLALNFGSEKRELLCTAGMYVIV